MKLNDEVKCKSVNLLCVWKSKDVLQIFLCWKPSVGNSMTYTNHSEIDNLHHLYSYCFVSCTKKEDKDVCVCEAATLKHEWGYLGLNLISLSYFRTIACCHPYIFFLCRSLFPLYFMFMCILTVLPIDDAKLIIKKSFFSFG